MEIADTARRIDRISKAYCSRLGFPRDGDWMLLKLTEEVGELTQAWLARTGRQRDRGHTAEQIESDFTAEVADVLGMVLAFGAAEGIDLEAALADKWLRWEQTFDEAEARA